MHFEGLFFGEGVLDEINFMGLDHILLIFLFVEDIYLLDELLNFNLIVFKFTMRVVNELVFLSFDLF